MVKLLRLIGLMFILIPLLRVQAAPEQQAEGLSSPASVLPADTLLYAEINQGEARLETLLNTLLPADLARLIPDLSGDLQPAWAGDQMGLAVLAGEDSLLPGLALIIATTDDTAALQWISEQAGDRVQVEYENITIWLANLFGAFIYTPGYVIVTDRADASTHIVNAISGNSGTLANDFFYLRATSTLSSDPVIRLYEGFNNGTLAFFIEADQLSVERIQHENFSVLGVPEPLDSTILEGVPSGALFVDTGMNPGLTLQVILNSISELFFLPDLDSFSQELLGVPFYSDLLPLLQQGYAFYVGYGNGSFYKEYGLPLEGGLILAPENPLLAGLTALTINSYLEETYDLSITTVTPTQYRLDWPDNLLPGVVYGLEQNRLYVSNESGAIDIINALSGTNLTDDPQWQRVSAGAPSGTQRIQYINLTGLTSLTEDFITTTLPDLNTGWRQAVFDYLARYEAAAVYYRTDREGIALTKWVIWLAN